MTTCSAFRHAWAAGILIASLGSVCSSVHADTTSVQFATLPWGAYSVDNDVWAPPPGYPSSGNTESVWTSSTGWGSTWTMPTNTTFSPTAYPSAYVGWHYGNHSPSSNGFPVLVSANNPLPTSVAYSVSGTKYDVAYDFFFDSTPSPAWYQGYQPKAEMMVWLKYTPGGPFPAGHLVASNVAFGNVAGTYDIWYNPPTGSPAWTVVSYVRRDQQTAASMSLQPFVWYAANSQSWISNSWYIEGMEFGVEHYGGTGSLNVTAFSASATGSTPSTAPIGHRIALKSAGSGFYVSTNVNNSSFLQAGWATTPAGWEYFDVRDAGNGNIALLSEAAGKYVTTDLNAGDGDILRGDWSTTIQGWEPLKWTAVSGGIALKSVASGFYVTCNLNNSDKLQAGWATSPAGWETFTYTDLGAH